MMNITAADINLVRQKKQRVFISLRVLNRSLRTVGIIKGRLVSGSVDISSDTDVRRSANLTIETRSSDISVGTDIAVNNYIRFMCGIENNMTSEVSWYSLGIFAVTSSGFKFDPDTRTLSLNLSDMMTDLNGERSGAVHAFTTVVKNSQRIDTVIKNVLGIAGVNNCDVCSIGVLTENDSSFDGRDEDEKEKDLLVPYDLKFSVGDTAYDIIKKCVGLYPYYEMGFDSEGVFYCRRKITDLDSSRVALDAYALEGLVMSEDRTIDRSAVKNIIEVWGKDGECYGEARDTAPDSPFNTASSRPMTLVVTDNRYGVNTDNICDRYKDTDFAQELLKKQAECENKMTKITGKTDPDDITEEDIEKLDVETQQLMHELIAERAEIKTQQKQNILITGDELAAQWAQRLLYEYARLNDTIRIQTVFMPFINDTDLKISYRSRADGRVRTYKIKTVSHDINGGTTTLDCVRLYNEQLSSYGELLETPVIASLAVSYMTVSLNITPVPNAQGYSVYIDGKLLLKSSGAAVSFTLPNKFAGTHTLYVRAYADGYGSSASSETRTVTFIAADELLVTAAGEYITTDNNECIAVLKGE